MGVARGGRIIDQLPEITANRYRAYVLAAKAGRRPTRAQQAAASEYARLRREVHGAVDRRTRNRARSAAAMQLRARFPRQYERLNRELGGRGGLNGLWALCRAHQGEFRRLEAAEIDRLLSRPWVCFYGTRTALVWATNETVAYQRLVESITPERNGGRRFIPPARNEVRIRTLRASDRKWIEQDGDKRWLAALDDAEGRTS